MHHAPLPRRFRPRTLTLLSEPSSELDAPMSGTSALSPGRVAATVHEVRQGQGPAGGGGDGGGGDTEGPQYMKGVRPSGPEK